MFLISGASANLSARQRWRTRQPALSVSDRRSVQCERLGSRSSTEGAAWHRWVCQIAFQNRNDIKKSRRKVRDFSHDFFAKKTDFNLRDFLALFSGRAATWSHRTRF